ncbi:hypothetical protein DGI_0002 [Megalodesulfovibrio gigas DSM 1382 = ATCC 19364]|uniref:Uncharacterized protein n=1 Tax=Megalodesulfovibrio gigas (strain ATCC 19364 / DSM 1382 / NCIMB 9332 / VKM B-1759) TaxID=1121448 RepID=T2G6W9_MEGG1|nr:hypothetical protein DGI_0002 [Megalodesulfovibrio gigas DSM 1382 = ATCC 19364]
MYDNNSALLSLDLPGPFQDQLGGRSQDTGKTVGAE